ncbi:UNVERIFIED_CONTAM: hypothetical protein GTU68_052969 [Idotea baltica]|nr:hypothetical protein [Idotea baltica]
MGKEEVIGVYAGTFDPITNGHLDLIVRALTVVDTLYVAVAKSTPKKVAFTDAKRVAIAKEAISQFAPEVHKRIVVESFSGLLVEYVSSLNARLIIRGLRAVSDYEYEAQMAHINRHLDDSVETVFLATSKDCSFISSSIVKNIAASGGSVAGLVPANVIEVLAKHFESK